MLCNIYVSKYKMKSKYQHKAWNDLSMSYNLDFLTKHNHREYFYFTGWIKVFENVNLESYSDMKRLSNMLKLSPYHFSSSFDYEFVKSTLDWYPINKSCNIKILCIKAIDDKGNIIDLEKIHHKFFETLAKPFI